MRSATKGAKAIVCRKQGTHRCRLAIYDCLNDAAPKQYFGRVLDDGSADDLEFARSAILEYNAEVSTWPGCTYAMGMFEVG